MKRLVMIGGFLGAGKTSLLKEAAEKLTQRGIKVGLITNDQAAGLVDTALLEKTNERIAEVSGSCFCCDYCGFTDSITHLSEVKGAGVVIAEPVGSCTDLSAALLQPLKEHFAEDLAISPLTVLVDPDRLDALLRSKSSGLHASAAYILQKQLEEADLIVINKADLVGGADLEELSGMAGARWPNAKILSMSVRTGQGVDRWLDEVLNGSQAGTHLAEVDYDIYAEGEAVLGWLNTTIELKGKDIQWDKFVRKLTEETGRRMDGSNAEVGHLKLILEAGEYFMTGNITGKRSTSSIRGSVGNGDAARLIWNARVQMEPDVLKTVILEALSDVCSDEVTFEIISMNCISPGRPNPTYRYDHVV